MAKYIDLTGKQFGHLTVVKESKDQAPSGEHLWICKCDCGNTITVPTNKLTSGITQSCGHARLNDKPNKTNTSGYRNISPRKINGKDYYRVKVNYKGERRETDVRTLTQALEAREAFRKELWPNYTKK